MAWRIVKQPEEGLYACFSDVADDFTHLDMLREEAVVVCMSEYNMTLTDALAKVDAAEADTVWGEKPTIKDGLNRWRDCMKTIKLVHNRTTRMKEESNE